MVQCDTLWLRRRSLSARIKRLFKPADEILALSHLAAPGMLYTLVYPDNTAEVVTGRALGSQFEVLRASVGMYRSDVAREVLSAQIADKRAHVEAARCAT